MNDLAYKLDFLPTWRVYPVMSVVQLYKLEQGSDPFGKKPLVPEPVNVDGDEYWEIKKIVDRRICWRKQCPSVKYLVR